MALPSFPPSATGTSSSSAATPPDGQPVLVSVALPTPTTPPAGKPTGGSA